MTGAAPTKRFAVLVSGPVSDYCKRTYGEFGPIFTKLLSANGEQWSQYNVQFGEFPAEADEASFDGFVITGSRYDAHADTEWINDLRALVQRSAARDHQKLLGVCFGHQLVAGALGGASGPSTHGWNLGLETTDATDAFRPVQEQLKLSDPLEAHVLHRDQVTKLPEGAEVLAASPASPHAMYRIGTRILCVQAHPEFNNDLLTSIIQTRVAEGVIPQKDEGPALETMAKSAGDSPDLPRLCRAFLKASPDQFIDPSFADLSP